MHLNRYIKKLDTWLFFDFPPLDGRLRIFFYLSLIFAGGWNIVGNQNFVAHCPPYIYEPIGFLRDFSPFNKLTPSQLGLSLGALSTPLKICWIFSMIGFLGRLPMMITGLLFMFFWGGNQRMYGDKSYVAPSYVLYARSGILLFTGQHVVSGRIYFTLRKELLV